MATHEDSAIFNLNKITRNWSRIGIWCHGSLWVFFWLPNLTKVMESFSKFYGIAFSQEEREVPWIIIKGLLARSRTLCGYQSDVTDHRFLYDPIPSVRGGWPKRITISLLLPKPIFNFSWTHLFLMPLEHDIKSWMSWKRKALKKTDG